MNYSPYEVTSRNSWDNAFAEYKAGDSFVWRRLSEQSHLEERDLGLLFTLDGMPKMLYCNLFE